jgi:hypothetical protein
MTFIGQALAAASAPCSMMDTELAGMAQAMGMDHSAHAMHDPADAGSSANCCADDACSMNGCIGSPLVGATTGAPDSLAYASVLNAEYSIFYLNPSPLLLIRPPIYR